MIEVIQDPLRGTGRRLYRSLERLDPSPTLRGFVNWSGAPVRDEHLPVLNASSRTNKLAQIVQLELKGIKVPPFALAWQEGYFPRSLYHQQGRDFTEYIEGDFWVKRLPLEDEWRLHFFRTAKDNMKLLRSGIKLPKTLRAHPWVKSHRLGWKLSYVGGAPQNLVEAARRAMVALQLDFGAVDVALTPRREAVVLEVNTCPGLEGPTLNLYVQQMLERLSA